MVSQGDADTSSHTTGRMSSSKARVQIVGRVSGRRNWTVEQKLAILGEAFASGSSVVSSSPIDFQAMLLLVGLLARHGIVAREKNINPDNLEKREPESRRGGVHGLELGHALRGVKLLTLPLPLHKIPARGS